MDEAIDVLRRFNRSFTQRIGVLDESFLGSGRPLGPSRLLFEIGPAGATVRELRDRSGLDSGYLSRLLRRLADDGLVTLAPDPADRRRRLATLTPAGRREWRRLDRRSERLAAGLIAPVSERRRAELVSALTTADRILRAPAIRIEVVDPLSDAATAALGRYFAELDARFPDGFDAGDSIVADAERHRAPHGAFVLARSDGDHVACGALQHIAPGTAEIKRMWVDPTWRGVGLGRRMLAALETLALERGHARVILDTNAELAEAIAMYESSGYRPIERYNDNPYAQRWFEKVLEPPDRGR